MPEKNDDSIEFLKLAIFTLNEQFQNLRKELQTSNLKINENTKEIENLKTKNTRLIQRQTIVDIVEAVKHVQKKYLLIKYPLQCELLPENFLKCDDLFYFSQLHRIRSSQKRHTPKHFTRSYN